MRNDGGFLLWWDGLRSEMQPIHDSQGVFAVLEKEVRRLGFDYYAYGVRHTIPFTRPKTEVHGTYPKAWLERYQMQNYGAVDPAILNGLRSSEMVVWSDSLFDQSRMLWNEARDWGLCVGATLPIRAPNNLLSVLSVARDQQNISSASARRRRSRARRWSRSASRPTRSAAWRCCCVTTRNGCRAYRCRWRCEVVSRFAHFFPLLLPHARPAPRRHRAFPCIPGFGRGCRLA